MESTARASNTILRMNPDKRNALLLFSVALIIASGAIASVAFIGEDTEALASSGQCGASVNWTYDDSNKKLTISGTGSMYDYNSSSNRSPFYNQGIKSVIIGSGVTSIGTSAFEWCNTIESVDFGSIVSIKPSAFYECSALESISFPGSLKTIGDFSFFRCVLVTNVDIPSSVESIENSAFNGCTSLTTITVDSGNTHYTSEDGILFNHDKTTLLVYPSGKEDAAYTIPDTVTTIGTAAFIRNSHLETVSIPNTVTVIGNNAFTLCTSLTTISIPNTVTTMGGAAFSYCSSLTTVSIPDSMKIIKHGTFSDCTSLTTVSIPDSVEEIEDVAFIDCTSLLSITIPASITYLSSNAFQPWTFKDSDGDIPISALDRLRGKTFIALDGDIMAIGHILEFHMDGHGDRIEPQRILDGGKFTRPADPVETGFVFSGWYKTTDLDDIPNNEFDFDATPTSNAIAYAFWDPIIPGVIYHVHGGSIDPPASSEPAIGEKFYLADYMGTKDGFTFGGWTYQESHSDAIHPAGYEMTMADHNMNFHAVWHPIVHVTYTVGGGSKPAPVQPDAIEGSELTVASYKGSLDGYSFGGWRYDGKTYHPGNTLTVGSSDIVFKAVWIPLDDSDDLPLQHHMGVSGDDGDSRSYMLIAAVAGAAVAAFVLFAVNLHHEARVGRDRKRIPHADSNKLLPP